MCRESLRCGGDLRFDMSNCFSEGSVLLESVEDVLDFGGLPGGRPCGRLFVPVSFGDFKLATDLGLATGNDKLRELCSDIGLRSGRIPVGEITDACTGYSLSLPGGGISFFCKTRNTRGYHK